MMPLPLERPPIFVGGAGRSGTTLLRVMLDSHPNIACGPELKLIPGWLAQWEMDRRRVHRLLAGQSPLTPEFVDDAYRAKIGALLNQALADSGKSRIAEKTPNNVHYFGHLNKLFPDSPLIHVIRDGRDVVASLLEVEWYGPDGQRLPYTENAEAAARYWADTVAMGLKAREHLPERVLQVRYEELVDDPEAVMRRVLEHVGEPWDDAVMHHHEQEHDLAGESSAEQVALPVYRDSVGRWQKRLSDQQIKTIHSVAGPILERLHYA